MKNFKLILKSLISNNACVEGGRKKPWYFAAIMFFLAMIFAILPLFVQTMKINGDDDFETYTYGADVACLRFNEELDKQGIKIYVKESESGNKFIACEDAEGNAKEITYEHPGVVNGQARPDFRFFYRNSNNNEEFDKIYDKNVSSIFIFPNEVDVYIVNYGQKEGTSASKFACLEAQKYLDVGFSINDLLSNDSDPTARLNNTFANWKNFFRTSYKHSKLTNVWRTCVIFGAINIGITLLMGFMIWVLTRGKNNPYRLFNLWHTQKMAWWAAITPSLLALGLGFLIPRIANILFPMLIGVRVMWLSMKSLRPDGSGYAESN